MGRTVYKKWGPTLIGSALWIYLRVSRYLSLWIVFTAALRKLEMNFCRQVEHPRRLTNLLPGKQGLSNS